MFVLSKRRQGVWGVYKKSTDCQYGDELLFDVRGAEWWGIEVVEALNEMRTSEEQEALDALMAWGENRKFGPNEQRDLITHVFRAAKKLYASRQPKPRFRGSPDGRIYFRSKPDEPEAVFYTPEFPLCSVVEDLAATLNELDSRGLFK